MIIIWAKVLPSFYTKSATLTPETGIVEICRKPWPSVQAVATLQRKCEGLFSRTKKCSRREILMLLKLVAFILLKVTRKQGKLMNK
jgi:hypothetical protein